MYDEAALGGNGLRILGSMEPDSEGQHLLGSLQPGAASSLVSCATCSAPGVLRLWRAHCDSSAQSIAEPDAAAYARIAMSHFISLMTLPY
jgi:hypothetical protein